jgi:hypothetical protein
MARNKKGEGKSAKDEPKDSSKEQKDGGENKEERLTMKDHLFVSAEEGLENLNKVDKNAPRSERIGGGPFRFMASLSIVIVLIVTALYYKWREPSSDSDGFSLHRLFEPKWDGKIVLTETNKPSKVIHRQINQDFHFEVLKNGGAEFFEIRDAKHPDVKVPFCVDDKNVTTDGKIFDYQFVVISEPKKGPVVIGYRLSQ